MQKELKSREEAIVKKDSTINILQHDKDNTLSRLELIEG